jgi:hypothetical protein
VQTFLPVQDFKESAKILDKRRAWQQVIEANAIIGAIIGINKLSKNQPAVRMWNGYLNALRVYYNTFLEHCINFHKIKVVKLQPVELSPIALIQLPPWIGYEPFHASHRSNLLRKNQEYYKQFGWLEPDNLPYIWPVDKEGKLCI